jgi:hypothetical protein
LDEPFSFPPFKEWLRIPRQASAKTLEQLRCQPQTGILSGESTDVGRRVPERAVLDETFATLQMFHRFITRAFGFS